MNEQFKIYHQQDGMIDFRRNASDTSRLVFEQIIKHERLCAGFALFLFNPDVTIPEHEQWEVASFLPGSDEMPEKWGVYAQRCIRFLATGIKRIWQGEKLEFVVKQDD